MSWDPGFQTILNLESLGEYSKLKDSIKEKLYPYKNGLILSSFAYDDFNLSNSDGVFCIFDARDRAHIEQKWKDVVVNIINNLKESKVALIGVRVSDETDWSNIMEEFNVNQYLEKKMVSLLFFKIGFEYRLEIYDQLDVMFSTITNL